MKLETAVASLIDILCPDPDDVLFNVEANGNGLVEIVISGKQYQIARLIGKQGVTVNAMRTIFHAAVGRFGLKSSVMVREKDEGSTLPPPHPHVGVP